ncbi:hypothetical protein ENUP19_0121G0134 [Entamoeba nuttalli]|uniref:Uncharacterized protein n=1 Tax=Entamoeba nuttalli TaxID=412467 RepID=A0ABQ0DIW0_9EUKA
MEEVMDIIIEQTTISNKLFQRQKELEKQRLIIEKLTSFVAETINIKNMKEHPQEQEKNNEMKPEE